MTKERSTTDSLPVPTHDGRSNDGKILPEFGAGRKACLREEVPHILWQDAVVYHRLYHRYLVISAAQAKYCFPALFHGAQPSWAPSTPVPEKEGSAMV